MHFLTILFANLSKLAGFLIVMKNVHLTLRQLGIIDKIKNFFKKK